MKKVADQILAYGMWIVDLLLAFWLAFLSRNVILEILALFYQKESWSYPRWVVVIDRFYTLMVGLGWLVFMIIVEQYILTGIKKGNLLKRIARVTGLVLLAIFAVDLIQVWLQGIGSSNWLRWLILTVELIIGTGMYVYYKSIAIPKTQ
jgi:hypothetical protein